MLGAFLALFGLTRQLHFVRSWAGEFVRLNSEKAKGEVQRMALSAAFALGGSVLALGTLVVLLMALHTFLAERYGPFAAYGAVAGLLALGSVILFVVASTRDRPGPGPTIEYPPARAYPDDAARAHPPKRSSQNGQGAGSADRSERFAFDDLRAPLSSALHEVFAGAPRTGTPVDTVIDEMMQQASQAADKTVDTATDIVRDGSRQAMFGVLAGTALLGWILARQGAASALENVAASRDKGS